VRALLAEPELLILDEPTTGLDPTVRHLLCDKVLSYRQAGKTVLLTTHYMHEAELLCDGIVILNHGAVVAMGSPKDLIDMRPRDSSPSLKLTSKRAFRLTLIPTGKRSTRQGSIVSGRPKSIISSGYKTPPA